MSQKHLQTFGKSIIPVITKCKPNSKIVDYDLDTINTEICQILETHFQTEIPNVDDTK